MSLLPYCNTEKETAYVTAYEEKGNQWTAIAQQFDKQESTIRTTVKRVMNRAALQGWSPDMDMNHPVPDTHIVKGVSTLYDDAGEVKQQWVKSDVKKEAILEALQAAVEAMKEDIRPIPLGKLKTPENASESDMDIIPWFNIGDAHIGALAHKMETGFNNDIGITERELTEAMCTLIAETPSCNRCVINDLGDATHYETFDGITMGHGHQLDFDTRYPKMIAAYVRIMRTIIESALAKFNYIDVIINTGNHSRSNDIFMAELLRALYGDTGRVTVLDNTNVFIPYRMGNTFVMCHHGDKTKHNALSGVMATDYSKDWGESTYRYIYTGHIHHREVVAKEQAGVIIESWNAMSKGDKYAHDGGWRSRKCLSVVELSKTYGEVGRRTIPIERVEDIIADNHPGSTAEANKEKGVYTV